MTNFDFLLSDPQFEAFASAAVAAERIYSIDAAACAVNCRRAMEFAVKWMQFFYIVREPLAQAAVTDGACPGLGTNR